MGKRVYQVGALALLLLVSACARPTGDFGRAERNVLNDEVMPAIGTLRADGSAFNMADQEVEMRDRVWRYLVAPHAYDWFGDVAVEFQRTRILPMSDKPLDRRKYYAWLHGTRFASSRVRFSRLEADVVDDVGMLPAAFTSVCEVIELDRRRGVAFNSMTGLSEEVATNAAKRQAENQAAIGWFVGSLRFRFESYSYALDNLLVETPHEEAVSANARLNEMALYVEAAERADFCVTPTGRSNGREHSISSRYLKSAPSEGAYRK